MKRNLLFAFLFLSGSLFSQLHAQYYQAFGIGMMDDSGIPGNPANNYQLIDNYGERLGFYFTNLPAGAWGNVTIRLYFAGDDGDFGEITTAYDETGDSLTPGTGNTLGTIGPNPSSNDCAPEDSVDITIPYTTLNAWLVDDTVRIYLDASFDIDPGSCVVGSWSRVKIAYNYCAFGTPAQFADLLMSDSIACPVDAPITLTGSPAGGTYSGGPSISGNTFDPSGLTGGTYLVTYGAIDSISCYTEITKSIVVGVSPNANDFLVCPGTSGNVDLNGSLANYYLYDDAAMTQLVDTGNTLTTQVLYNTDTYYIILADRDDVFMVDTITTLNSIVIEHGPITGDDRGGLAITPTAYYINGDDGVARFDEDLGNPSAMLPRRDGLFSDLRTGLLWTLYSTVVNSDIDANTNANNYMFTGLRQLDSNMNLLPNYMPLSAPIHINGNDQSGMFAGYGFLILYNGGDQSWYVIDMDDGTVQNLGGLANPAFNGSENWSSWGVAEYNGAQFSVLYRDNNDAHIHRRVLPADPSTIVANLTDVSDLASFTYSPWNSRWYFHYEGSGEFGGFSETSGYTDGLHTIVNGTYGPTGCVNSFDAIVHTINLGADTSICQNATPFIIEAGNGYESYTWNGVNNNWNIFPVTTAGPYIVDAVDEIGCHIIDTINVNINACIGIEENNLQAASIYPNPSNGNFMVELNPNESGNAEVEIMDMQGRKLYTRLFELTTGIQQMPIQLFDVMDGIYLVNIRFNNHVQTFRLVISK